ncbi:MAG: proton-conducting transporter membrane subunit [Lachnospiraceae bacterium]|nr:proton-conducting transporter membrane subunit [Lachnospiraceae bacterium]
MVGALIAYLIGKKSKTARDYFANSITIIEFAGILLLGIQTISGAEITYQMDNFCGRGLSFQLDGFRFLYGLIASFMWMMTTIFSKEYFKHYRNRNRYYFFLLITLGATIGVFLSADLYTTFIFFEIMSFTSYVWVAHDEKKESLFAAETYLAIAVIGGMVMLMGLFLLFHAVGTLNMEELFVACKACKDKTTLYIAGGCMLFGFGAKAGMFPLHIWLPKAHSVAPAPASALLSGILTKSGIFGILVISCNIFLHDMAFGMVILTLGVVTMFLGALLAVFSINLKRTLACSSVSQIGFILVGIGMQGLLGNENSLAVRGTILHMVNHSFIKLVLFMAAGVVYFNLHQLDLNKIRGFGRKKPLLFFSFLMGALAIGGIPLWSGYVSKTLLHESIVEYAELVIGTDAFDFIKVVEGIFLFTGGLTVAYMMKIFVALFIEKNDNQGAMDASNGKYMNVQTAFALVSSAILLSIIGLSPSITMNKVADLAQGFLHGKSPEYEVHYLSFENLTGGVISIAIGIIIYFFIIRTLLMKRDEQGKKYYVNLWRDWIDLENLIYRPVIQHMLPFIFGFIFRIFDRLVDGIVILLQKTIFREAQPKKPISYGNYVTHAIGVVLDGVTFLLNKTIYRKRPIKESFTKWTAVGYLELTRTSRLVSKSVSFGLLLFCIGLIITLLYLLSVLNVHAV